jgi:glycopeptide antibiotics resistance protein
MKRNLLALSCIAVLCTILILGLWPFHSPINGVTWLANHNGLRFSDYGTVISSGLFQTTDSQSQEGSLEIWLQPKRIWDSGTFLAFYRPPNLFQFSLRQTQTDLVIRTAAPNEQSHGRTASLSVTNCFTRKPLPVLITITAGANGTSIYIDGVLASNAPTFPVSTADFTGQLVLGDSPGQTDSWSGEIRGVAIYGRQLTAAQVFYHYANWERDGQPGIAKGERTIALYQFQEHTGVTVRDQARSGVDLYIPARYQVMNKIVLEPFWTEFEMTRSYWDAVVKNIVGFVPLGFCFCAYLGTLLPRKPTVLATVFLGAAVSFTIELLQGFLPTRASGTTDLITNTIGTWVGVLSYNLFTSILRRPFARLAFPPPARKA